MTATKYVLSQNITVQTKSMECSLTIPLMFTIFKFKEERDAAHARLVIRPE